jgi:antitoxin component of RelBE/YafQ-DinJ toxin-antitoxin module
MKKTEVLKFRVDAQTRAALQEYCRTTGLSPSHVVRNVVDEFTQMRSPAERVRPIDPQAHDETVSARIIATLLIAHRVRNGDRHVQENQQLREVARLVDELLKALWGDQDAARSDRAIPHPLSRTTDSSGRASGSDREAKMHPSVRCDK